MPEAQSLVLFDIDGTLLRGAGPHHKSALIAGIQRELNIATSMDGIETAGTLDCDLIRLMVHGTDRTRVLDRTTLARVTKACEESYLADCAADLRPRVCPGVLLLLENLRDAGVILGVVTGNLRVIGWKKLELAGLREYFATGAFAQDGSKRAELAQVAADRAARLAPSGFSSITLIGDHLNDIAAAKANGFRSIGVATGVLSASELAEAEPDLIVRDMTGLTLDTVLQAKNFSIRDTSSCVSRNSSAPIVP